MQRGGNGKGEGARGVGSRELDMINHHHLSLDNAVQCAAVGGGKSFRENSSSPYPTALPKYCHRINLRTKCSDLLDAKFLRWEAFCSRVEIVALTNSGVYLCRLSRGAGGRGRI